MKPVETEFEKVSCSTTALLKDHMLHQLFSESTYPTRNPDHLKQTMTSTAAPLSPVGCAS